jgi:hypothetical protein
VEGLEKAIQMIKTQSQNKEIRQISVEARDEVWYGPYYDVCWKVGQKVSHKVWDKVWRKLFE